MKRTTAALALAASAVLLAACGPDAEKSEAASAATTVATPSTPVIDAPAPPAVVAPPSGPAAAPGAPSFAVLYPGASLDQPAVTASGPAGPGGLVTYTTEADPEAVIAFASEFFIVPNSSLDYVKPGGKFNPENLTKPIFTRNLAVRR